MSGHTYFPTLDLPLLDLPIYNPSYQGLSIADIDVNTTELFLSFGWDMAIQQGYLPKMQQALQSPHEVRWSPTTAGHRFF